MHTLKYDNLTVSYEMEGDVDGNHAIIRGVVNEKGHCVSVDKETAADMKFIAESEYADLQYHHYMKTGEII